MDAILQSERDRQTYRIADHLDAAQFLQMESLEKRFYSSAFITPAKESFAYYKRFPRSTVAAVNGGIVIGFVNLFPVRAAVYSGILCGAYNDSGLTSADMADPDAESDAPLHMFLSCIAVDRAFRKQGVTRTLLRAAVDGYASVSQRCDTVATDNATEEGRRFSERIGFRFVCESDHASTIYAMPYREFVEAVFSLSSQLKNAMP